MTDQYSLSKINRRDLLQNTLQVSAGLYLGLKTTNTFAQNSTPEDPHFFLQLFIPGGVDSTYLFDARPLAMTSEKLLVNYHGKEPILYTGRNGTSCLRTDLTNSLMAHSDSFSVINGVLMSTNFDGHPENESYFLSGQALGGVIHIQDLAHNQESFLTGARFGFDLSSEGRNTCAGLLKLNAAVGGTLVSVINRFENGGLASAFVTRFGARLDRFAKGSDSRSITRRHLKESLLKAPKLSERLAGLKFEGGNGGLGQETPPTQDIETLIQLLKGGITNCGFYVFNQQGIDSHDSTSAKALPARLGNIADQIAAIFTLMKNTPYDATRSMFDVTTILVGSEFSRTMKQSVIFEESGTDHNPLNNSVLVAGKGIEGGLVLGASDFESVEAYQSQVSAAHLQRDPSKRQIMAKPFNFESGAPRSDLPAQFDINDYLTIGSVINTVYDSFNVPKERWRRDRSASPTFPMIKQLRKG